MTVGSKTGRKIELSEEGYFEDPSQWDETVAREYAAREGLALTTEHLAILEFLRERHFSGHSATIRSITQAGLADVKKLYELFPDAPIKTAIRLAGLPKPKGCF
jgi:tRNA 2-thiouridine synthesizing protein E